jgi:hypothetical protein
MAIATLDSCAYVRAFVGVYAPCTTVCRRVCRLGRARQPQHGGHTHNAGDRGINARLRVVASCPMGASRDSR